MKSVIVAKVADFEIVKGMLPEMGKCHVYLHGLPEEMMVQDKFIELIKLNMDAQFSIIVNAESVMRDANDTFLTHFNAIGRYVRLLVRTDSASLQGMPQLKMLKDIYTHIHSIIPMFTVDVSARPIGPNMYHTLTGNPFCMEVDLFSNDTLDFFKVMNMCCLTEMVTAPVEDNVEIMIFPADAVHIIGDKPGVMGRGMYQLFDGTVKPINSQIVADLFVEEV